MKRFLARLEEQFQDRPQEEFEVLLRDLQEIAFSTGAGAFAASLGDFSGFDSLEPVDSVTDSAAFSAFRDMVDACATGVLRPSPGPRGGLRAGPLAGAPMSASFGRWTCYVAPLVSDKKTAGAVGFAYRIGSAALRRAPEQIAAFSNVLSRHFTLWHARMQAELDLVTETRRAERFRRVSELDPLTRLENAATFRARATDMFRRAAAPAALILLDIDNFKSINDTFGHQFGDRFLKRMARAIERGVAQATGATGPVPVVGRLGGDEFAILLPAPDDGRVHDLAALADLADRTMSLIVAEVQQSVARLGKPNLGHVSLGAALFPFHADRFDALFDFADAALYSAKSQDLRRPSIFRPEEHDRFSNQLLNDRFETALVEQQLVPHLQPLVHMASGTLVGFEALARWQDPERGLLLPDRFSAIFSDPDMAPRLTRAVVLPALDWIARRRSSPASAHEKLSVNLTTFELINPELVSDLEMLLTAARLDWSAVMIEVTEKVMLGPINGQVFRTLEDLRTHGATVALDDFGTGYGSLQHLKNWPVDVIKIDRSFVADLGPAPRDHTIIAALIAIGRDLDLTVVAEGIETEAAHHQLVEMGCQFGQGFLYGRPQPPDLYHRGAADALGPARFSLGQRLSRPGAVPRGKAPPMPAGGADVGVGEVPRAASDRPLRRRTA